jgi:hypothetical protein
MDVGTRGRTLKLGARIRKALGWRRPAPIEVPVEVARWLEPIRWESDVYADVARIVSRIDIAELERLRLRYENASPAPGYSKYLDIATYLAVHVRYARQLGLASAVPGQRRVLDVGTGAGYFPLVCRHYGHTAVAIDLDTTPMYNELVRLLGIDRVVWRIEPYVALPAFPQRFDVVTAMQIKFDGKGAGGRWGADEWLFLLRDLADHVSHADGQVFLGFNADASGRSLPDELGRFFARHGGHIDGWSVRLRSLRAFAAGSVR